MHLMRAAVCSMSVALIIGCSSQVQLVGHSAPTTLHLRPRPPAAAEEAAGLPAHLVLEQRLFEDSNGNQALDAEEQGSLLLRVRNDGLGTAKVSVRLTALTDMTGIVFPRALPTQPLGVGEAQTLRLPFQADAHIASGVREVRVEIEEELTRTIIPFALSFPTHAVVAPEFRVIVRDYKDGSFFAGNTNDGRIQTGEMIKVIANVQNVGGEAFDVVVEVDADAAQDVRYTRDLEGNPDNLFVLGDMGPGENRDIEYYFFTTPLFADDELRFRLRMQESRERYNRDATLRFEIGEQAERAAVLMSTALDGHTAPAPGLHQDVTLPSGSRSDMSQALAVIFGIEDYRYTFDAAYKVRDAVTYYRFCRDVLGIPESRILLRTDEDATKAEFDYVFEPRGSTRQGWLKKRLQDPTTAAATDLLVFVAGHGFPDMATGQPYLIPHDVRPEQTTNGVSLDKLYELLGEFGTRSVTVFVESCFSGGSGYDKAGSERQLALRLNPVLPVVEKAVLASNTVVFAAASGAQPSSNRDDVRHGIFSYCVLRGLAGAADADGDKDVDISELYAYLARTVPPMALQPPLDREQNPRVMPSISRLGPQAGRVLVRF